MGTMHIDMLSIFLLLSTFCYLQLHVAAFTIIASRFVLKSPLWRATNPRSIVRMQQSIGIPSIPGSIMTDFGRTLRDDINKILVPIQDESTLQEELRDTVYREVRLRMTPFTAIQDSLSCLKMNQFTPSP